jgi:hypothetical protein
VLPSPASVTGSIVSGGRAEKNICQKAARNKTAIATLIRITLLSLISTHDRVARFVLKTREKMRAATAATHG